MTALGPHQVTWRHLPNENVMPWDVAGTLLIVEVFQFSHLHDPDADDFQNVISISLFTEYIFGEIFIKMRSVY